MKTTEDYLARYLAQVFFFAFLGAGTNEKAVFEGLKIIKPHGSSLFQKVSEIYRRKYSPYRDNRGFYEDLIYELKDDKKELEKVKRILGLMK